MRRSRAAKKCIWRTICVCDPWVRVTKNYFSSIMYGITIFKGIFWFLSSVRVRHVCRVWPYISWVIFPFLPRNRVTRDPIRDTISERDLELFCRLPVQVIPSLLAVNMFRHFGPRIMNSQIKSQFLIVKLSFWTGLYFLTKITNSK